MGLSDLFSIASFPVIKTLLLTVLGSLLALDHINVLAEMARKELNGWEATWHVGGDELLIDKLSFDSQHLNVVSSERLGPIDNADLIENINGLGGDALELHRNLVEGQDYVLVPQQVWEKLFHWVNEFFNCFHGGNGKEGIEWCKLFHWDMSSGVSLFTI